MTGHCVCVWFSFYHDDFISFYYITACSSSSLTAGIWMELLKVFLKILLSMRTLISSNYVSSDSVYYIFLISTCMQYFVLIDFVLTMKFLRM